MCGIAGLVLKTGAECTDLPTALSAMARSMAARGPDDEGTYVSSDGRIGLGNRRLAIQDLSPAGHMPMSNAQGTVWITYNGEIYNTHELRADLERLGYTFQSRSDTEVILHGFEVWGRDVVGRLRGMFALAIYDMRGQPSLFLARDPLGIKPLYYTTQDGVFAFASECRAVLAAGLSSAEIGTAGLVAYLQLGSVPAPLTIYRSVRALEAGHSLVVDCEPNVVRPHQPAEFWALPSYTVPDDSVASLHDAVEEVRQLLLDSVRRHLISDVPLGAFLSGGIDSGAIVALMRQATPTGTIRTCTVVFEEPEFNEAAYAHQVARRFETEHVDVPVTASDLERELEHVLRALDQPSNDGINAYFVSRAARATGLTVALSGVGGDELFGGYPTFHRLPLVLQAWRLVTRVPGGGRLLEAALSFVGDRRQSGVRLAGWLNEGGPDPASAYLGLRGLFSAAAVRGLVRPEALEAATEQFDLLALARGNARLGTRTNPWDDTSRLELSCYMRHQLLRDTDVMSMANSLEVRVPFVDRHVVERILRLSVAARSGSPPKRLLREAVSSLPLAVRDRRDKQGFTFPFQRWMSGPLRPMVRELVHETACHLQAYLRPEVCDKLAQTLGDSQTHWSRPWALAALNSAVNAASNAAQGVTR
jgi:asparagine synthase (glutamine-hydrolysing)